MSALGPYEIGEQIGQLLCARRSRRGAPRRWRSDVSALLLVDAALAQSHRLSGAAPPGGLTRGRLLDLFLVRTIEVAQPDGRLVVLARPPIQPVPVARRLDARKMFTPSETIALIPAARGGRSTPRTPGGSSPVTSHPRGTSWGRTACRACSGSDSSWPSPPTTDGASPGFDAGCPRGAGGDGRRRADRRDGWLRPGACTFLLLTGSTAGPEMPTRHRLTELSRRCWIAN